MNDSEKKQSLSEAQKEAGKRAELIELARAALAVAEGTAKPENFPPEIAMRLGEVEVRTVALGNSPVVKTAVKYFGACAISFLQLMDEQGVYTAAGEEPSDSYKQLSGQLAVDLNSMDLRFLGTIFNQAADICEKLHKMESKK